ncbi:hypothetical protein [Williamsia sp. DF01-3]|uniref:hypothetical protein n=1 Tax=Williamsia sp. DF01-3 TaxID=2934157 RepID=UPI001FF2D9FD|nr:hypothetical protein [Williamsia sp. DF01-3]MCK0517622.1 hypothetical protein [Williamsia sp. DF01-3]
MITTFTQIDQWELNQLASALESCGVRGNQCTHAVTELDALASVADWAGEGGRAAKSAIGQVRKDLDEHGQQAASVAAGLQNAISEMSAVQLLVADTRTFAFLHGLVLVDDEGATTAKPVGPFFSARDKDLAEANADTANEIIADILVKANDADRDLATAIMAAAGRVPVSEADRQQNQIAAFEKTYRRKPVTESEWALAEFLDENTSKDLYGGMDSNVVVAKINPIPGQGIVRGSLFIKEKTVLNPGMSEPSLDSMFSTRDYGNDRTFDPNFDPQDAKGAFVIDYENGFVIYRQNPTVDTSGAKTIGNPDVRVDQASDGTVRLDYNSPNPAANVAGVNGADLLGKQVKGTLLVAPGDDGPQVSGTIGDYPSTEIYVDRPDGSTATLLQDDQDNHTEFGPALELGSYHIVGQLPPQDVQNELDYDAMDRKFGPRIVTDPMVNEPSFGSGTTKLTPP